MSAPMRVTVVRPYRKPGVSWGIIACRVGLLFLTAWWLMLAVAYVTPWHLSYWQTVVGILAVRTVQVGSGFLAWTAPGQKGDVK